MLIFTSTEKDKPVLNHNGYQYTKKRANKTNNEWRCRNRTCSSTISLCTNDVRILRNESAHTCQPDTTKVLIDIAVDNMKKRGNREETLPIPKIYSQEVVRARVANPGLATGRVFPTLPNVDASLYHRRALNYPKLPTTTDEIALTGLWRLSKEGGEFLLVDEKCTPCH
ncbi:unnamed protein product [Didymodactylos carnosus]|uniref:FLYWCH-type domain-containing protein n=1 Tax=Didymodactylos carnosus TaxID=1234261 RepID=A0A815UT34_9BILA|nr:unnamed protein product [Didymodactylos carnosus]CAF4382395.1 unnamed protein product [Didymodactylos carnosus]